MKCISRALLLLFSLSLCLGAEAADPPSLPGRLPGKLPGLQPPATAKAAPGTEIPAACCEITAIDKAKSVVSARERESGRIVEFKVGNSALLQKLRVGQAVHANFSTKQVSVDGKTMCCTITSVAASPTVASKTPAQPTTAQTPLPSRAPPAGLPKTPGPLAQGPVGRQVPDKTPGSTPSQPMGTGPGKPASPVALGAAGAGVAATKGSVTRQAEPLPQVTAGTPRPAQTPGSQVTGKSLAPPKAAPQAEKLKPVAFLVNGFTGCCIPKKVREFLVKQGAKVYVANWNDLEGKRDAGHFTEVDQIHYNTDEYFIKQMQAEIAKYPEPTPIILIAHSFGGDAALQVTKRIDGRRIAFLGVLDPVGRAGLRANVTDPVPSNVDYFFNRWEQNPPIPPDPISGMKHVNLLPVDSLRSGELKSRARGSSQKKQNTEKSEGCKTKYRDPLKAIPQLLTHSEVPNDSCIQQEMIKLLEEKVFH